MNQLYQEVGISKQAVNQYSQRQLAFDSSVQTLIAEAEDLRENHPGCGVEKMYHVLKPEFMGRDRFIEIMMSLGFRIKRSKNYSRTTYASPFSYQNLIKGLLVNRPSKVWQSDITYISVAGKFYYAVFIIDVFTKKIVGYHVADNMRATANMKALKMALKDHKAPDIHHSDRGSQYGYKEYIKLLNTNGTKISMAKTAQDNAYAERINRTIKEEYLDYWKPKDYNQLKRMLTRAVRQYNNQRPHKGIGKYTPSSFEEQWKNNQLVKNYAFTIFDSDNILKSVNSI